MRKKNRGGDITPIRLRRSLFFVAPATPAGPGTPSPARVSRPSPADPAGPAAAGPALPSCPRLPRPPLSYCLPAHIRAALRGIGRHCAAILLPSHCFPAHYSPHDWSALVGIGRIKMLPLSKCSSAVSREIPGLCSQSRVCGRPHDERHWPRLPSPSGPLPLRRTPNEPMPRKRNVLYCVDTPRRGV